MFHSEWLTFLIALVSDLPSKRMGMRAMNTFPALQTIGLYFNSLQDKILDNLLEVMVDELEYPEQFTYRFANVILHETYALLDRYAERHREEKQSAERILELCDDIYTYIGHQYPDLAETLRAVHLKVGFVEYLVACVKVCWLLTVVSLKMSLVDPEVGETFDRDRHTRIAGTGKGETITALGIQGMEWYTLDLGEKWSKKVYRKARVFT